MATAAWTAVPVIQSAHCCLPPVQLPSRALVTNPVSTFVTATCDLAGIDACCRICIPVPKLHHGTFTLRQRWVALLLFVHLRVAGGTFAVMTRAAQYGGHPFMTTRALPFHFFGAASYCLMCSAMIFVSPLCCYSRSLGSKRVGCYTTAQQQPQLQLQPQPQQLDLSLLNPALHVQWHPVMNTHLTGVVIKPFSNRKVWWMCDQCPDGHPDEWEARVNDRSQGRGCPFCACNAVYLCCSSREGCCKLVHIKAPASQHASSIS